MKATWPLEELLPMRRRMILLDDLLDYADDWASAGVRIAEDSLFFEPRRGVPAVVGMEYMAQTIALFSGLRAKQNDAPIRLGLLLGARGYKTPATHFALGDYLEVRAVCEWDDGVLGRFECEIRNRARPDETLASARIQVYLVHDILQFDRAATHGQ